METEFGEYLGQFSRDGRWLVYTLDDSGQEQVYVQTVPPSGAKFQISTAGGSRPRWRRDGRELYYVTADRTLMAVPVMLGSTLKQARLRRSSDPSCPIQARFISSYTSLRRTDSASWSTSPPVRKAALGR